MIAGRVWLSILCLGSVSAAGADWPQWRGPLGTGHVPSGVEVPQSLPAEPKVLWRLKVGDGLASPVVSGGKVFHLDNQQGKETVHALDAETGRELWSAAFDAVFKDTQSVPGPRCTPLVDGDRLYVQSCRGEFGCLDIADGRVRWRVNFVRDFQAEFTGEMGFAQGAARHGYNGPPVIDGERMIVGVGGTNGASLVCFEKTTGRVLWKSQNDVPGYAPPVVANLGGVRQVVSFTAEAVLGLDEADGALLWRIPVETDYGRHATTPVVYGDRVCVSSHQAGLMVVGVSRAGAGFRAEQVWVEKGLAINFASPVAVGKYLYGVGPAADLVCVDLETGRAAWRQEGVFTSAAGQAYGGFLVAGGNVLILTDAGLLVLCKADPNGYQELGRVQVCGSNWCNPAYADGRLYLRDARHLLCVQILP